MVKTTALFLLMLGMASVGWATAETRLTAKADKNISVLGEPVLVEIRAEDAREPLSSISLEKLKRDFNVYAISSSSQTLRKSGRSISTETMSLTLYPLRSGKLNVPAFSYRGSSSKAIALVVNESGKSMAKVIFKAALDTPQPRVRQASTLTLEIHDDGTLQWTAPPELLAPGVHQRRLSESQSEEMLDGKRYTVHRYAWALMPLREGKITVEFPLLDAFKFGTRLRYPLPPMQLNAAAVPAYLPVHVPIGQLQVSAEALPTEIALDRPVNWTFTVAGTGVSEEGLGKLVAASVRNSESMRFYPAVIGKDDSERALTAMQKLRVALPFVAIKTGALQLPEISLPYYDPASARIESASLEAAHVEVFNPLMRTGLKIALALLLIAGFSAAGYWLYIRVRRNRYRLKILLAIGRSTSADELHAALLKFADENESMRNATLRQWLQHMQRHFRVDERLSGLVHKLEIAKYADQKVQADISILAQQAAKLMKLCRLNKN